MLLDRFTHHTKGGGPHPHEVVRDEVAEGTLSSFAFTCTGDPIAVSLTVAEPPAVSRLHLHWTQGLRPEMRKLIAPSIIAAHGRSILFETYVPLANCCNPEYYPSDYFLYTAPASSGSGIRSPVLRRLPTCFIGGLVDPVADQYYIPHRIQQQRPMFRSDVGLLCRGEDDEFAVASLLVEDPMGKDIELCVLHHSPAEKKKAKWRLKKLPVPSCTDGSPPTVDARGNPWETDTFIAIGDRYLCWVDLYLGFLFVDVITKPQQPPRYVPLPERLLRHPRRYIDLGCVDPASNVCVTDTGLIKLIFVSNNDVARRCECDCSCSAFTIKTWTLVDFESDSRWEQDASYMKAEEFWAALAADKRLPCVRPEFPVMNLVQPDVIYFTLKASSGIFWLIEVDMKKKVLGAVKEGEKSTSSLLACLAGTSFMPTPLSAAGQFTRYMNQDAIKSIRTSNDKLQESKEQRATEKCLAKYYTEYLLL